MKKVIAIILIILAISGIGIGVFFNYQHSRTTMNNDNAVGNTSGNLLNGGLFCEYDGKIYFANPNDYNKLYVMNSDCTDIKKLNEDSVAYINVCGKYIYYAKNNFNKSTVGMVFRGQLFGLYRCDLDGGNEKILYNDRSGSVALSGNTIFYQHYDDETALTFYRVGIDGKKEAKISDTAYLPASVSGGKLYFSDPENKHHILSMDAKTNSISDFYSCNSYLASMVGGYAYYIDLSKNYSLVRYNTSNQTLELLYAPESGKIINYNVYGNKVFFQVEGGDKAGLYRMNIDGTQVEYVAVGEISGIHCTEHYTFFSYYTDQSSLYRVPTMGSITTIEEVTIQ